MRRFCPYCGQQITAGAIKCHYCGRILKDMVNHKKDGNDSKVEKTEQIESSSISLFELLKSDIREKFKNKRYRNIAILAVIASMLVAIAFYTNGPTEYRVAKLSAAHDDVALIQMVDARSKSSFFTNVTKAAAKALISLKNKQYINDLSGYLLDENVNVRQKEAIITAFTDSKMLVPNFFTIYDKNVQLQEVLQKNGLSINPKIFEKKMFAEVNNYLKFFRSNPGDYDNQIDALQRYNVDGFADDNMFTNLKGIADIYAIQKYLHEDDNNAILQYIEYLDNQPDVPILAKNTHFFKALAVRIRQKKVASDNIAALNKEIADMHIEDKILNEQKQIYAAQERINATKYIEYFGIKYSSDNALYVSLSGGGWAKIINPPSEVQSFKKYNAYVIKTGEIGVNAYYKEWLVPVYKIVDIDTAEASVKEHQSVINKIYSAKTSLEDKIAIALQEENQANADAGKLFDNMGKILDPLTAENVFDFSRNSGHVPLFAQ